MTHLLVCYWATLFFIQVFSFHLNIPIFSACLIWGGRVFHNFVDLEIKASLAMSPEID